MSDATISRATYDALSSELEQLTTVGRIEIAKAIAEARALGDLRENGDYHAARDAQGKMEARIRQIEHILANATIVEETAGPVEVVSAGTYVSLRYDGDDEATDYFVGSIEERHRGVEVVSPTSPLGQALIGAREGEWVEYTAPGGMLRVEVVRLGR